MPSLERMERTELAWAAGFWDGEGSAYLSGSNDRKTKQPQARINQASTRGVPEVLVRFQKAVGFGSVQGPDLVEGRDPLYRWVVSSRREVREVLLRLGPWLGSVKHVQLERTLGIQHQPLPAPTDREELIAWCAGLFDGEGSVYLASHQSHPGYFVLEAAITQSSTQGEPAVLRRFQGTMAVGKVYGPYPGYLGHHPVYRWKAHRRQQITSMIGELWPQLGTIKRIQAGAAIRTVSEQPTLPRGNPAWGAYKTHCVHGHEYATARVRPFRSRGSNTQPRRASKQCLACVREHARRRRLQRESGGSRRRS